MAEKGGDYLIGSAGYQRKQVNKVVVYTIQKGKYKKRFRK